MGKRKSSRKPPSKVRLTLDREFNCLFCNHEKSVSTKLDFNSNVGYLSCKACNVKFQAIINALSEPIDVYSEWIDACERANAQPADRHQAASPTFDDADDY
ncbi:uncharacterized protein BJ171DRAFT_504237 [Polychytrium aggregatum]|uniref:uncharacterized protein n=1 Tax=Polychytrium aggregatum TaxID=110093 RepID=UPI0022FF182C|nr:uncharacterized protein BJ171DRAFT_504237 [Polychytrium aggregatum]KAI9204960.1 hypothetical protein BJ171DRAFT_504237 [Polychytrium aggregatum]